MYPNNENCVKYLQGQLEVQLLYEANTNMPKSGVGYSKLHMWTVGRG